MLNKSKIIKLWGGFSSPNSSLKRKVFKNFSIGSISSILNLLLGLGKTAILAKYLSISDYGSIMIAINFFAVFNLLLDIKINDIIFRFYSEFHEVKKEAFIGIINMCLVICAVLIVLSGLVVFSFSDEIGDTLYGDNKLGLLLRLYLFAGAFNVLNGFSSAILRLRDKFATLLIPQVIGNALVVSMLFFYFIIFQGNSIYISILIIAIGTAFSSIVPFYIAFNYSNEYRCGIGFIASFGELRDFTNLIKSTIIQTNIASYLKFGAATGGTFLLGVFGSSVQVAYYNLANQLIRPLTVLQNNLQPAVYPEIVKLYKDKSYFRLYKFVQKITIYTSILGGLGLLLAFLLVKPVILLISTPEFLSAIPTFYLLLSTVYLTMISLCFYPLVVVMDVMKRRNLIVSIRFLFLLVLPFFGFTSLNLSLAQLTGTITTRVFNDIPLLNKLKIKAI